MKIFMDAWSIVALMVAIYLVVKGPSWIRYTILACVGVTAIAGVVILGIAQLIS